MNNEHFQLLIERWVSLRQSISSMNPAILCVSDLRPIVKELYSSILAYINCQPSEESKKILESISPCEPPCNKQGYPVDFSQYWDWMQATFNKCHEICIKCRLVVYDKAGYYMQLKTREGVLLGQKKV